MGRSPLVSAASRRFGLILHHVQSLRPFRIGVCTRITHASSCAACRPTLSRSVDPHRFHTTGHTQCKPSTAPIPPATTAPKAQWPSHGVMAPYIQMLTTGAACCVIVGYNYYQLNNGLGMSVGWSLTRLESSVGELRVGMTALRAEVQKVQQATEELCELMVTQPPTGAPEQ